MDLKKLLIRSISGLVYVAIIIGCILWGDYGVALLGSILAILATLEFSKICHGRAITIFPLTLDILGAWALAVSFNPEIPVVPLVLWVAIMLIRFTAELYQKNEDPIKSLAKSMLAQIYIGVPLACMSATAFILDPKIILIVFFMLWINDTGAYLVGSLCGKHRLFERLSPKKSWEGFFGGLFFNIIAAVLFCYCSDSFMGMHANLFKWISISLIVTIFGTWGDLVESMIKRQLHIKDSGNIIPGHGGILDRIDSFLLAMPAVFVYLATQYLIN